MVAWYGALGSPTLQLVKSTPRESNPPNPRWQRGAAAYLPGVHNNNVSLHASHALL